MQIKKLLTLAAFVIATSLGSQSAMASYDYTGSSVDMGTVSVGDFGVIGDIDHFGATIVSQVAGTLPSNSMITFTYNFSGNIQAGVLGSFAEYDYTDGGDTFTGFSSSSSLFGNSSVGTVNGSTSTPLAVASAQIDFSTNTATAVIKNVSSGTVDFLNLFVGLVGGSQNLEIAYSVSAVPLPAALPLFLSGLAALMGISFRRRKQAELAA
ncbi:MAG: VPLPA-CTERM sorting domain-containing protein [Alphaproteobacteria bacterium]